MKKSENSKVVQVCKEDCDNKPTDPIKVGTKTYVFCCLKGFEKSLKDYQQQITNQ